MIGYVMMGAGGQCASDLREDIGCEERRGKAASGPQPHRNSGIEMAAGDRTQGIGSRQHGQAECQRHAVQADTHVRKPGRDHGAPATSQDEPERAKEFRGELRKHGTLLPSSSLCAPARTAPERYSISITSADDVSTHAVSPADSAAAGSGAA